MTGVELIVVLILMGGLISYLGDRIGMRVGRRRLSLFGMRPRHSSVIVTVVTGTSIAALTLGTLTAVSHDVRTALFRMSEIQTALAQANEALLASEAELAALKESLSGHREEVERLVAERDKATVERDEALSEREALAAEIEKLEQELAVAEDDLETWKSRVASMREVSESLEDAIVKLRATEERLRRDISELTRQYIAMESRLRAGEFVYLKDEIVAAAVVQGGERAKAEAALLDLLEAADARALERGARIEGKERALELGREEYFFQGVEVLSSQAGEWVARVVAAQNTVAGEPLRAYLHLFPRSRIFAKGEVIVERVLDGGRPDIENALLAILDEVNRKAILGGMVTGGDGGVGHVSGEAFVEALLALRRSGGPAKVAAIAAEDTWNTEGPLEIKLVVTPS